MSKKAMNEMINGLRSECQSLEAANELLRARIIELERKKAELIKDLEAYSRLTDRMSALMLKHKNVFTDKEIRSAEKHLNEIEAEAGRLGWLACWNWISSDSDLNLEQKTFEDFANEYAERIRKGGEA
jgi:predicted RNase H-like nuclease (RuvC/YqgF family)